MSIIGIPAAFGLRRFSRGWRIYALAWTWLGMIAFPILFVVGFITSRQIDFNIFDVTSRHLSPIWLSITCLLMFLLNIWQYRVLTRRDIIVLFGLAETPEHAEFG
jgi:hypothetical protein